MAKKIDILKHRLVPQHILLKDEEAEEILRKMGLRKRELPWILASDPVAQQLGAKPGDIVMIIRKSPTAGRSVAFRLVMPG